MTKPGESDFRAPLAIQIHGETLANMNLEQYTAFVRHLGKSGMHVTASSEPASELYFAEADTEIDQRFLVDHDSACDILKRHQVSSRIYGKAWYFLEQCGYYYPNTPRGVFNSAQHLGERPLFYYATDRVLDEETVLRGHGDGIDFERGLKAGTTVGPNLSYQFLAELSDHAKLDIQSLRQFIIKNDGAIKGRHGPGEPTFRGYEILCDHIESRVNPSD